jgi:hypothetical protein
MLRAQFISHLRSIRTMDLRSLADSRTMSSSLLKQILAAVLRPTKDAKVRPMWNQYHHWVGRSAIVIATINVYIGLHLYKASSGLNHHPHFIIRQTGVPSVANGHQIIEMVKRRTVLNLSEWGLQQ